MTKKTNEKENKANDKLSLIEKLKSYNNVQREFLSLYKQASNLSKLDNYIKCSENLVKLFKEMKTASGYEISEYVELRALKKLANQMVDYDRAKEVNNSWESVRDTSIKLALLMYLKNESGWVVQDNTLKAVNNKLTPDTVINGKEVKNPDTSLVNAKVKDILSDYSSKFATTVITTGSGGVKKKSFTLSALLDQAKKELSSIDRMDYKDLYSKLSEADISLMRSIAKLSHMIIVKYDTYEGCTSDDDNFTFSSDYLSKMRDKYIQGLKVATFKEPLKKVS